jgi:hypothetical protein
MSTAMKTFPGEVRTIELVDVSVDPYDRRNAHPKPGLFDVLTYGQILGRHMSEVHLIALNGLEDEPQKCRDCSEPVGYHRDPDEEGMWIWHPLFLLCSSGHTAALCPDCAELPEPVRA